MRLCDICHQPLTAEHQRRNLTAHFACIVRAVYGPPVTRSRPEPLHYISREEKRLYFGDWCEMLRYETVKHLSSRHGAR